jgi:predicted esterase
MRPAWKELRAPWPPPGAGGILTWVDELPLTQHTLEVPRTARYHVLGSPGADTRAVEFALHGYGQLARAFLAGLATRARPGRVLIAPEGLSRFYLRRGTGEVGASWMTKEERGSEIVDTLRYLDRLAAAFETGGRTLSLLGFSQGAAAAARWAVLGTTRFARVTLWGCPLPHDLALEDHVERVRALRWIFAVGARDTTIDRSAVERDVLRVRSLGAEVVLHGFEGGHELDPELLARLE